MNSILRSISQESRAALMQPDVFRDISKRLFEWFVDHDWIDFSMAWELFPEEMLLTGGIPSLDTDTSQPQPPYFADIRLPKE